MFESLWTRLLIPQDPFFNIYSKTFCNSFHELSHFFSVLAQVVGQKLVWLAPPDVSEHVSPYSSVDSNMTSLQDEDGRNLNTLLGNTSRLDVFANEDELGSTFKKTVTPVAMSAVLEAGDVLFFPPGWWHAMRSESVSFSVSMWFWVGVRDMHCMIMYNYSILTNIPVSKLI